MTYQTPQSPTEESSFDAELVPKLPYLSTKATKRNRSFSDTKELFNTRFFSTCTELTFKNVRCDAAGFIRMLTELAPRLRFFSYRVDHPMSDGVDRETAGRVLPLLSRVEELHFVPFTGFRNVDEFIPSQLDIAHCWPLLRHLVTSDKLLPFSALAKFSSPDVALVEYYLSDTENHSSYEAFDTVISLLPPANPAKIYLYGVPSFTRLQGDENYVEEDAIDGERMTYDWSGHDILRAKRRCKARSIELRYWGKDEVCDFVDEREADCALHRPIAGLTI
jgi:hypothetical protein